jgi:choline dehydrogenase
MYVPAQDIGTTIFHPTGTCKMGKDCDPTAVVSAKLQVHGVAGLRIADASIMPHITSGNTAAPAMMIAEKCAQIILTNNDAMSN